MSETSVSGTVVVDAPPDVVFGILASPRRHPEVDGSGSVRRVVSGPERLTDTGQRFAVRMRLFGLPYAVVNRVVEFEPDRRIAWRHFTPNRWRYELEPTGDGGTRVTETFDWSRSDRLNARFVHAAGFPERNRQGIADTLQRLKAVAEAEARSPGA